MPCRCRRLDQQREYANYVADSLKKPDLSLAYLYLTLNKASRLAGEGKFVLAFECTTYAIGLLIAAVTLKERIQTTKRVVAGEAKVRSARASKAAAASHASHHARLKEAERFYRSKPWRFKSHAIKELMEQFHVAYVTAKKWVDGWTPPTPRAAKKWVSA